MTIKDNDILWTTLPSDESKNYETELYPEPREPWQGIIWTDHRCGKLCYHISSIDPHGKPDIDPNATAFVRHPEKDLFETKELANLSYFEELNEYANDLSEKLDEIRLRIRNLKAL